MLKKLFRALMGQSEQTCAPVVVHHYAGYLIYPEPIPEGGQYRLAGRICKEVDGKLLTHRFIRSDLFASAADAEQFMLQKAQRFIDQSGEQMFAASTSSLANS